MDQPYRHRLFAVLAIGDTPAMPSIGRAQNQQESVLQTLPTSHGFKLTSMLQCMIASNYVLVNGGGGDLTALAETLGAF